MLLRRINTLCLIFMMVTFLPACQAADDDCPEGFVCEPIGDANEASADAGGGPAIETDAAEKGGMNPGSPGSTQNNEDQIGTLTGVKCGLIIGAVTAAAAAGASAAAGAAGIPGGTALSFDSVAFFTWLSQATTAFGNLQVAGVQATGLVLSSGTVVLPAHLSQIIIVLGGIVGIKEADMVGKTVTQIVDEIKAAITGCWDECAAYFAEANAGIVEIGERWEEDLPPTPPPGVGCGPMWGALCISQAQQMPGIWPFVTTATRLEDCQECCIDMFNVWLEGVPERAEDAPGCRTYCDSQCTGWFN